MSRAMRVETAAAPAAIGPYSQAVRVGDLVWCSGQIPLDPVTGAIVGTTAAEQAEQVLRNLAAVLDAAGLTITDVVKTTIFLADLGAFAQVNEVYGRWFLAEPLPARATVEVAGLPRGVLVEIDAIAHG